MPPESAVTDRIAPPVPRVSSKTTSNSAIGLAAAAEALSSSESVQVLELPVAGTVGVKDAVMVCEAPRLSKYSTGSDRVVPSAVDWVAVAGRLTPSSICVVGEAAKRCE